MQKIKEEVICWSRSENKNLFAGTPPENKNLFVGTVAAN